MESEAVMGVLSRVGETLKRPTTAVAAEEARVGTRPA